VASLRAVRAAAALGKVSAAPRRLVPNFEAQHGQTARTGQHTLGVSISEPDADVLQLVAVLESLGAELTAEA
jgi:hypothetical protein